MLYDSERCTLFNRRGEGWSRTVLDGVCWTRRQVTTVSETGARVADSCTIRIRADARTQGKRYVPAAEWAGADPEACWTIQEGDVAVRGEARGEPSRLLDAGAEAVVVRSFSDNRRGSLPHWRIGGA